MLDLQSLRPADYWGSFYMYHDLEQVQTIGNLKYFILTLDGSSKFYHYVSCSCLLLEYKIFLNLMDLSSPRRVTDDPVFGRRKAWEFLSYIENPTLCFHSPLLLYTQKQQGF